MTAQDTHEIRDTRQPPRRHRHRGWWWLGAGVLALAAVGAVGARYLLRAHPGPQAIETAVRRFRASPPGRPVEGVRYPFPAAGVYELHGQGSERISFPPNTQRDGAVMPATVRYVDGGCWLWHVDYNVAHWEEYRFCPQGGQLVLAGNSNSQTWDFGVAKVKNLAQLACEPPSLVLPERPTLGLTWSQSCSGTNSAVPGGTITGTTTRVVGQETLDIGGKAVPAVHVVQQTSLSGGQSGSVTEDWWHSSASGLPLRMVRHITVGSKSPLGGTITYTEDGSWQMATTEPRA